MAPFLQFSRRTLTRSLSHLKAPKPPNRSPPHPHHSPRRSISSTADSRISTVHPRISTVHELLLRLLRSEIDYETRVHPPRQPVKELDSFVVEERPGEQWVRLSRRHGEEEEITVEATMFDGFVTTGSDSGAYGKLHISLVVDVKKGEGRNGVLQFLCSAWPDSLVVKRVFSHRLGSVSTTPYMGPKFRELDEELQEVLLEYLRERAVDDDLAGLLHEYMNNKDRNEVVRWMENVKSFIEKLWRDVDTGPLPSTLTTNVSSERGTFGLENSISGPYNFHFNQNFVLAEGLIMTSVEPLNHSSIILIVVVIIVSEDVVTFLALLFLFQSLS